MSTRLRQVPGMPPPETLSEFLSGLKDSGCALLITGETDPETRTAVSRQLFGAPESTLKTNEPRRKRILVQTEQSLHPRRYLPTGVTGESEDCAVLDVTEGGRSTTTVDGSSNAIDPSGGHGSTDLTNVAESVEQRTDKVLEDEETPAPAELRLGCSSLLALGKRFEQDAIEAFADSLTEIARRNRGMCHLHYPKADAAHPVRRLSATVNARLEIETVGNRIYVTWYTPYENVDGAEQPIDWFDIRDK